MHNQIKRDQWGESGGGGGISCTPSKDFEKFGHKNVLKLEIEEPLNFLTTSIEVPTSK